MSEIERILNLKEKKNKNLLSKLNLSFKNFLLKIFSKHYDFKEFHKRKKTFSGWGLTTTGTIPPWENKNDDEMFFFKNSVEKLKSLIKQKTFRLTQFEYKDTNYDKIIDELSWRHYVVFNSVLLAIKDKTSNKINLVECGVCDGLTIYFALKACEKRSSSYTGYLYDAWENLKNDKLRFQYSYLDLEVTKKNLNMFYENLVFNKGFIPKVFDTAKNPDRINWLHIDLNSNEATQSSLNFFYNKITSGGVMLFDDYGGFHETRNIIDDFIKDKKGHFINYPTGQGVFLKF